MIRHFRGKAEGLSTTLTMFAADVDTEVRAISAALGGNISTDQLRTNLGILAKSGDYHFLTGGVRVDNRNVLLIQPLHLSIEATLAQAAAKRPYSPSTAVEDQPPKIRVKAEPKEVQDCDNNGIPMGPMYIVVN